jgi:hypothetical protein
MKEKWSCGTETEQNRRQWDSFETEKRQKNCFSDAVSNKKRTPNKNHWRVSKTTQDKIKSTILALSFNNCTFQKL